MTRALESFPGGLQMSTFKDLSNHKESYITPLPDRIILPLQQHIGMPAVPLLKTGDKVLKGQIIARADGYVSVPIHASTSGKIIDIGDYSVPHSLGLKAPCIVIEPDGNDTLFDITPTENYDSVDPTVLQEVIREAGIVGLGGAGFPAHVKLKEGTETAVDTLIINGVECEPYISCDDRLIREKPDYIVAGTRMIQHAVQAKHCVIAVEDDMPEAYSALEKLIDDDIELIKVPARYPAGGEKQLIKVLTGKEVPTGGLPIHIGIVMHNVGTAAAAYRAVTRGEPLISRYVTITGDVKDPRNLQVLLGTPVKHCAELCGYDEKDDEVIILGGPMMGKHVQNMSIPVIKTTNCVLVTPEFNREPELPCIRCGDCVDVCPEYLLPQQLFWFARAKDHTRIREHHLFDCIECGCCAYVCPSNIPLVRYYRSAKDEIAIEEQASEGADHAHQRFEARDKRLEREKKEHDSKQEQKDTGDKDDKQAYIKSAVERTEEKREQLKRTEIDRDNDE
ncbi:MAG: electron transport complex subunit RsxC [Gammaproteobacteria bacterium]